MYLLNTDGVVRIVQITDTHLNAATEGHLLGMQTLHSLQCVLDLMGQEPTAPHAMLMTGDLSQDGSVQSYQHLQRLLSPLPAPSFWLPGNHDVPDNMSVVIKDTHATQRLIRTPHWQIILLDSSVRGKVYGHLSDEELQFANDCLAERPDLHSLVSFHHHPMHMGSRWIDTIGVQNGPEAMQQLTQHNNLRCLLWGHVHQESDRTQGNVRLLSTPSTCVQFTPASSDFQVDTRSPGFRWIDLHPDGQLETGVKRVENIAFEVDYSVKGY